jgi:cell division protein FtsQ
MYLQRRRYRVRVRAKKKNKDPGQESAWGSISIKGLWKSSFWVIPFLVVASLLFGLWTLVSISSVFAISEISVEGVLGPPSAEIRSLIRVQKGDHLLKLNLNQVRSRVEQDPSVRRVVVKRVLPSTLKVEIDQRHPIAQIKSRGYYMIDAEGVLVPPKLRVPDPSLPIIEGSDFKGRRARLGESYESEKIQTGLRLLEAIQEVSLPFDRRVEEVHVKDLKELSFKVEIGLHIQIGKSDFSRRLDLLHDVYEGVKHEIDQVKYIDLRFDDVVIGYRK